MIIVYIFLIFVCCSLLYLIHKVDTAIELIFNKLNIDSDIWGSDRDVWYSYGFYGRYGRFNNTYYSNLYFIWPNG